MAKNDNLTDFLTDIANTIRSKKGVTYSINPQNFSNEINTIQTSSGSSDQATFNDYINRRLSSLTLDDTTGIYTLPDYIFTSNTSLTSAVFPDTLVDIGDYSFQNCTALTTLTIPGTLTNIGSYAFDGCSNLTNLSFNSSNITIGEYAFQNCTSLTSIPIDLDTIGTLGEYTFYNCSGITSITLNDNLSSLLPNYCFAGMTGLNTINYNITNIYSSPTSQSNVYIFNGSGNSDTVLNIASSVTAISNYIWSGLTLKQVNYEGTLSQWTQINFNSNSANQPLSSCGLLYIDNNLVTSIPDTLTTLNPYSFYNATCITSISINSTITSIPSYCFYNTSVENLVIPSTVTSIDSYAFYSSSELTSLTFQGNVTLGSYAFGQLPNISITCTDGITVTVGTSAFRSSSFTTLTIPNNLVIEGTYAFAECTSLTSVTLSEGITDTGDYTFRDCSNLVNVTLPQSLTRIGAYAFADDTKITTITVPANVTYIGTYAFDTGLTSIRFEQPATATVTIPSDNMFDSTKGSRSISVYCENEVFLNYDYSGDNYNPTFYHLDGTAWDLPETSEGE